jgi:hypothetical protein
MNEYQKEVRFYVEQGMGLNDLNHAQKIELLGDFIASRDDAECMDLIASFGEKDSVTIVKMVGMFFKNREAFSAIGACDDIGQCWLNEYADVIQADFEEALEQMRLDDNERRAERSMAEG